MTELLLVLITVPESAAEPIAAALIDERLAACVSRLPSVHSVYRWRQAVERAEETLLLVKTCAARWPALQEAVVRLHPYELPEILAVPVAAGLPDYLQWASEACAVPTSPSTPAASE